MINTKIIPHCFLLFLISFFSSHLFAVSSTLPANEQTLWCPSAAFIKNIKFTSAERKNGGIIWKNEPASTWVVESDDFTLEGQRWTVTLNQILLFNKDTTTPEATLQAAQAIYDQATFADHAVPTKPNPSTLGQCEYTLTTPLSMPGEIKVKRVGGTRNDDRTIRY